MIFNPNILYHFNLDSLSQSRRLQQQLFRESHRWRVPDSENSEESTRVRNLSTQRIYLLNGIIYSTRNNMEQPETQMSINVHGFLDYHRLLDELARETLNPSTEVAEPPLTEEAQSN